MTFYVIRSGWNAANKSAAGTPLRPKDEFQSNRLKLVAIVQASTKAEAIGATEATVYANQFLFTVTNPRAIAGLTREIRKFEKGGAQ